MWYVFLLVVQCGAMRSVQHMDAIDTMHLDLELGGSKCDNFLYKQMKETFGMKGKCEDENDLEYTNPSGVADVLYIYPKEDHNGAFSMCDSNRIDPHVCYRLVHMAKHYSVHFVRVGSVQEATAYVKSLSSQVRLKHVVLGGHGDPTSLAWGPEETESASVMPELRVDEANTKQFLDALYPHLVVNGTERTRSTIFLDACLNGKSVKDKNMLLFVAHHLAGAEVFASKISFDNGQFTLKNYLHFNAQIREKKKDKMVNTMFHPKLRELNFYASRTCKEKELFLKAQTLEACATSCEAAEACNAFTYFPEGNSASSRVCYHSKVCEMKTSNKGAMVFMKPEA